MSSGPDEITTKTPLKCLQVLRRLQLYCNPNTSVKTLQYHNKEKQKKKPAKLNV
jgi:hypothetical protein